MLIIIIVIIIIIILRGRVNYFDVTTRLRVCDRRTDHINSGMAWLA